MGAPAARSTEAAVISACSGSGDRNAAIGQRGPLARRESHHGQEAEPVPAIEGRIGQRIAENPRHPLMRGLDIFGENLGFATVFGANL